MSIDDIPERSPAEHVSRRVIRGFRPQGLRAARKAAELKVADLARLARIGVATIERWEAGSTSPQIDKLAAVAKVLTVEIDELIDIPADQRFPGDWRNLIGLTQPQLGAQAGLDTSTVGRIERGETDLTDKTAVPLAAALGIDVAELRASHERARNRPAGTPA